MSEIDRSDLEPRFWAKKPMADLSPREWEALCDGCGKCCMNKLEDEEQTVALTCVACKLFDDETCLCGNYMTRHRYVPECIVMTPETLREHLYWLPQTCAYRLVHERRPLYDWHPLVSGDPMSVHRAGVSMRHRTYSETTVNEDDWDDYIIEEPV